MSDSALQESDVMTTAEAAVYMRVNPQTIYRRLKDGTLPGAKVGRTWRVRRSDLDRFLAGTQGHTGGRP